MIGSVSARPCFLITPLKLNFLGSFVQNPFVLDIYMKIYSIGKQNSLGLSSVALRCFAGIFFSGFVSQIKEINRNIYGNSLFSLCNMKFLWLRLTGSQQKQTLSFCLLHASIKRQDLIREAFLRHRILLRPALGICPCWVPKAMSSWGKR